MRHAAPGPARGQTHRREGGKRRAGKRRSGAAIEGGKLGQPAHASQLQVSAQGLPLASGQQAQQVRWVQLPYWLIVIGICAALVIVGLGTQLLKSGTLVLAGVLIVAATARLVLPDRRAGMLSSRRRLVDVGILALFGAGLLVAGLGVPSP